MHVESLKTHLSKDYVQIDSTLLERLTRAGIMCPTFTERQKMTLLQTARIDCPPDIVSYLVMSNTIVAPPPGLATPHTNTVLGSAVATTTPMISPMTQPLPAPQQNEYWQRDLDDSSSISSIIRDIQQCIVDEKEALPPPPSQAHKPVLSPWAPSYSPKNDIWRMAPVESTHGSTKNLLTA
jgi:hypothetical protein